jgi:hypothetical protein
LAVVALLGFLVAQHYRPDLFDDYQAGYHAGQSLPAAFNVLDGTCEKAADANYPQLDDGRSRARSREYQAFVYGCADKQLRRADRPWHVHRIF